VAGKPLTILGKKLIKYSADGVTLFVNYYVCDIPFCLVSVARLLFQGYWTGKDCMKLLTPQEETVNVTRHGTLLYLTPCIVAYDETVMNPYERALDEYMNTLGVDPNCAGIPQHDTSTDAVDQLKVLINVIHP